MTTSIVPTGAVELSAGQQIGKAIYNELDAILVSEQKLEHSYARLGALLVKFKQNEHWREMRDGNNQPYTGFDFFMRDLAARYHKSTSQLYAYESVAATLLPYIHADYLDAMGITKATELKRAHKSTNAAVPEAIIEQALRPDITTKELRALLFANLNMGVDDRAHMTYFDFGGAYLTKEERAEFLEFIKVGKAILQIQKGMPDWAQRKELLLWAAREFTATHAPEVYGKETPPEDGPDNVA